jgi:hypothetical protein
MKTIVIPNIDICENNLILIKDYISYILEGCNDENTTAVFIGSIITDYDLVNKQFQHLNDFADFISTFKCKFIYIPEYKKWPYIFPENTEFSKTPIFLHVEVKKIHTVDINYPIEPELSVDKSSAKFILNSSNTTFVNELDEKIRNYYIDISPFRLKLCDTLKKLLAIFNIPLFLSKLLLPSLPNDLPTKIIATHTVSKFAAYDVIGCTVTYPNSLTAMCWYAGNANYHTLYTTLSLNIQKTILVLEDTKHPELIKLT